MFQVIAPHSRQHLIFIPSSIKYKEEHILQLLDMHCGQEYSHQADLHSQSQQFLRLHLPCASNQSVFSSCPQCDSSWCKNVRKFFHVKKTFQQLKLFIYINGTAQSFLIPLDSLRALLYSIQFITLFHLCSSFGQIRKVLVNVASE